jgi:hypothetical protein
VLLRASGEHTGDDYDLTALLGEKGDESGIPNAGILLEFAEAAVGADPARLEAARAAVIEAMGGEALADAAGVAALFNAIDRVADATGIPLEDEKAAMTEGMRAQLGINDFGAVSETADV